MIMKLLQEKTAEYKSIHNIKIIIDTLYKQLTLESEFTLTSTVIFLFFN